MRVLIAFVLCAICVLSVNAATIQVPVDQPTIQWVRTYGGNLGDYGVRIIQTPDSGYAFLGRTFSFAEGNDDYYLLRLDENGDTLWSKTYGGPAGVAPQDIINTFDGGFMICGSNSNFGEDSTFFAMKTDNTGNPEWLSIVGYKARADAVVLSYDSQYVFAGFSRNLSDYPRGFVIALDENGDSVWSYTYSATGSQEVRYKDVLQLRDSTILAMGIYSYDLLQEHFALVTKLSKDGDPIWNHLVFGDTCVNILTGIQISDTSVAVAGYNYNTGTRAVYLVMHIDGSVLQFLEFPDTLASYVIDVNSTIDRGFILCAQYGSSTPAPKYESHIIKYDSNYVEEWRLVVDSSYDEVNAFSIALTYEGGYIFGGYSDDSTQPLNMYALKIATQIPYISFFSIDGINPNWRVVSDSPLFVWSVIDPQGIGQTAYEIEVTDNMDWAIPPPWITGIVASSDTAVIYGGSPLVDGITYFVRIRVSNGQDWSPWYETTFRMNSAPTVPVQLHPTGGEYASDLPTLWVLNSTDAEGDTITYNFSGYHDTDCVGPTIDLTDVPETPDSTGGQVTESLGESCFYWWRARAFDGHEHSDWSPYATFVVNALPEPPLSFKALYPPDTGGLPVFDLLPEFIWERSFDPDPLDTVRYNLQIAVDPYFNFDYVVDSIIDTAYTLTDSLQPETQYWWRVWAFDQTGLFTVTLNTLDFWTAPSAPCCNTDGIRADADNDCTFGCVNVADLSYLVAYLFQSGPAPVCEDEADADSDCTFGCVNVADLSYLVAFLFQNGPEPGPCP